MRVLRVSAINAKELSVDMESPKGWENLELVPIPSVEPNDRAMPAKVLTLAVEIMIFRISWLDVSAINAKEPSEEMEIPKG